MMHQYRATIFSDSIYPFWLSGDIVFSSEPSNYWRKMR